LIWTQFGLANPGNSAPIVPPPRLRRKMPRVFRLILVQKGRAERKMALPPTIPFPFKTETASLRYPVCLSLQLLRCLSLCYAESKVKYTSLRRGLPTIFIAASVCQYITLDVRTFCPSSSG
jgi:hypothetical protein